MKAAILLLPILVFIIGSNTLLQAQNNYDWQWINQLGGIGWDLVQDLACTKDNKTYFTGRFQYTLFAGPQSIRAAGSDDIFLACYDNKGNLLSLQAGGGKGSDGATCMTIMNNDDIILCGYISDTITIGNLISESAGRRLFITKRTNADQFAWLTALIPSSAYSASLFQAGSDNDGNIYAAGVFSGTLSSGIDSITSSGGRDIFIVKLNSEGTIMDLLSFGGNGNDEISAMHVSPSGNIYIAGSTETDFYIGGYLITDDNNPNNGTNADPFILCFTNNYTALWKTQINGLEYCEIASLAQDASGNIYATGSYNMQINVGDSVLNSKGYTDGFLIKYGTNGVVSWANSFGSWYYDYANDVKSYQNGTTVVAGNLSDTIQLGNIKISPYGNVTNSAVLIEFSTDGRAQWGDCISGSGRIEGHHANFDLNGNIYFAGSFNHGNAETKTDTLISAGDQDLFLACYHKCTDSKDEISGKNYICPGLTTDLRLDLSFENIYWNDEASEQHLFTVDQPGVYSVKMIDQYGCPQSDSVEVTFADVTDFSLGDDINLPVGNSLLLNAPENFENYVWQDGSASTSFLATALDNEPGTYIFWLTAEDSLGCFSQDTIIIEFYSQTGIVEHINSKLKVYPVPATGFIYLTLETNRLSSPLITDLIDLDGRIILSKRVENYSAGSVIELDISNIASGLYYLRLNIGTESINKPCIIKH